MNDREYLVEKIKLLEDKNSILKEKISIFEQHKKQSEVLIKAYKKLLQMK